MGPDEEGEGGRSRDEAEWIRRFSLSSFRPDASSPPQIHSETKGRRKSWPMEWRQREKGEKQRKEACIRIGERKKEALLWLSAQTLPRCLRRRRRRLPLGVENPFNSKLFSYSLAIPPFFAFYFVLPLYFHINSYGDQRGAVGVYINAPSLFAGPFIPNRRYSRASLVLHFPF